MNAPTTLSAQSDWDSRLTSASQQPPPPLLPRRRPKPSRFLLSRSRSGAVGRQRGSGLQALSFRLQRDDYTKLGLWIDCASGLPRSASRPGVCGVQGGAPRHKCVGPPCNMLCCVLPPGAALQGALIANQSRYASTFALLIRPFPSSLAPASVCRWLYYTQPPPTSRSCAHRRALHPSQQQRSEPGS